MTQPPITPQYYTPPPPNVRPTSVTVLAVIGIIFGGIGALCSPFALIPYFIKMPGPNPVFDSIKGDTLLLGWTVVSTILGWLMAIVLLTCSIGALMLKRWARGGLIYYSVVAIILGVVGFIINMLWLFPKMAQIQTSTPAARGGMMGGMIGGMIGMVIGLALPVLLLIFMTRPHVVEAFERGPGLPGI